MIIFKRIQEQVLPWEYRWVQWRWPIECVDVFLEALISTKRSQFIICQFVSLTYMSNIPVNVFDQDFKFQRMLGKGNYASVSEVYHVLDKKKYAVKQIITESIEQMAQALNEIEVLKILEDQHATKIFYHFIRSVKKPSNFQVGIVMELCETSLAELIKERRKKNAYFSAQEVRHFIASLVPFFAMMQRKGYIHRDIKPDNILINRGRLLDYRVADFGFAIKVNSYSDRNVAGTMEYVSPKLLVKFKNQKISVSSQNFKDDVFSFGKTLSDLMTLSLAQPLMPKKIAQCRQRYGDELFGLLERMIAENEQKRVDFVSLEALMVDNSPIERPLGTEIKVKTLSNSGRTTPRVHLRQINDSITTQCHKARDSKQKGRVKTNSNDQRKVKIQNCHELPPPAKPEPAKCKLFPQKPQNWKQSILKMKQQVYCMALSEMTLFLGLGYKLGMMLVPTQKLVMLLTSEPIKKITCLKVSSDQETLYVGGISGKLFCLPICELNKLIIQNQKSFKINNTLEVSLNTLIFREISLQAPIGSLYLHPDSSYSAVTVIVGHLTGEVSIVTNNKVERKVYFSTEPITCIALKGNFVYSSSAHGVFKRQKAFSLGVPLRQNLHESPCVPANYNYPFLYRCGSPILTFQIISECRANKTISQESRRYLALLVEYDGYIHIVSAAMKCERMISISEHKILGAWLQLDPQQQYGVEGLFVDEQGTMLNQKEEVVKRLGQKGLCCIVGNRYNIFCGGFDKNLVILGQTDGTIDLQ